MSERELQQGDRVRHRDAPPDGPVGTVKGVVGNTGDGAPIYQVGFRTATGATQTTRYPAASLVLVEEAPTA
ncbi:MAG: hypothetical protein AB7V42_11875 [Thermoleophilia bacterium]